MKEAKNLRKFAYPEELENLHLHILDPDSIQNCVYGQMTGNCFSSRAKKLIEECCERVYNIGSPDNMLESATLNGSPKGRFRKEYWSPIEVFIYKNRKNKNILAKLVKLIKEGK